MKTIIKTPTGEIQIVDSIEGHEDCEVLQQIEEVLEFGVWIEGQGYVVDEAAKAAAEEEARLAHMTEAEKQQEAIAKATADLLTALANAGIVTEAQATALNTTLSTNTTTTPP